MRNPVKEFFKRGMAFGGFGPVILAIIYLILSKTVKGFTVSGTEAFSAVISTYLLAFLQAGASIFNQMENWPIMKSLLCHFSLIYVAYAGCYLINSWIPFDINIFLIFTAIFVVVYLIIWIVVFFLVKAVSKKMNKGLN